MALCRTTLSQPTWRKTARQRHLKHCNTNIEEWILVWYDWKQTLNPGVGDVYSGIWMFHVVSLHQGIYSSMLSQIWQKVDIISTHSYACLLSTRKNLICIEICSKLLLDILKLYKSVNSHEKKFRSREYFFSKKDSTSFQMNTFDWVKWYNACPGYYTTVKEIGWQLAWWILF